MRLGPKLINQSGDTIVEVMIAVAVVSSVLASAFLVAQKSAMAVRNSQEHGEMMALLQGQVELVRSQALEATDDTSGIYDTSPKYFCMDVANPTGARVNFPAGFTLPAPVSDTYSYPGACKDIQSRYNVAISYNPLTKIFSFYGRWNQLNGQKAQEQMFYRVYPGQTATAPGP